MNSNMTSDISAEELTLKKVFSEDYFYKIPEFQRPFSWEKENFEQLIEDLIDAYLANLPDQPRPNFGQQDILSDIGSFEPYFLGSIILLSDDFRSFEPTNFDVVDGQQRLISLSILFAVIRDLSGDGNLKLQKKLKQEKDEVDGIPEKPRMELRPNKTEKVHYKKYILKEAGTLEYLKSDGKSLNDPSLRMKEACEVFQDSLEEEDISLKPFASYLSRKVLMVTVKTNTVSSAFRLFNVINDRGMPLSAADLLKSQNLRGIPEDERDEYTQTWEGLEEDLNIDTVETLINLIRSIKVKDKARRSIQDEFRDRVFAEEPSFQGKPFIDFLDREAEIYREKIDSASLDSNDPSKNAYYFTLMKIMDQYLPDEQWMAGFVKFCMDFEADSKMTLEFLKGLERVLAVKWLSGASRNDRLQAIYQIIEEIENVNSFYELLNSEIFTKELSYSQDEFETGLGQRAFYRSGRYQKPKYLLLRLDMERRDLTNVKLEYVGDIHVEHILPKNPDDEYWTARFDEDQQHLWKHKLGNLTLLNDRKNYSVSNKPFPEKVEEYFLKKSDFAITEELRDYEDWNMDNLKKHHQDLIDEAKGLWF